MRMTKLSGGVVAALLTVTLAGCSSSKSVDGDELAKQVSSQLTKSVGQKPDKVSCPKDLPAKKGAKARCTLTDSGKSYGVSVTATSVKDDKVKFNIAVDQQPKS